MPDLKCGNARRWLQAPNELAPLEARYLERHLEECPQCDAYHRYQVDMDRQIRQSLDAAVTGQSVRSEVRARLVAARAERQGVRPRDGSRRSRPWKRLLPAIALAPVSAAALAFTLILTSGFRGGHGGVPAVGATPWHPKRIDVGYPITIDPSRPAHLLAGAWGEVYQSWNNGNSWEQLGSLPPHLIVRDLAIDSSDPNRYVVATLRSILVSEDAGKHWTVTARGLLGAQVIFLLQHPRAPGTFYAGPSVLWKSLDHGHTWERAGQGAIFAPDGIQSLAVAPNGDLYTGIWHGGVAVSHDGGLSWQRRSRGLAPDVLDVTLGSRGRLWAATDRGIYQSTDTGGRWRRSGPSVHFYATGVLDAGSYVLAGGNGGVFRSTDGGKHWDVSVNGLPLAPYVFGFIADPHNANTVFASLDDNGLFRSDDGGQTWHSANAGLQITGQDNAALPVLFRRHGHLWLTDGNGSDPGSLTVDNRVRVATTSSDGAAVVYLTGMANGWAARVVGAGGSSARTIATGAGPIPHRVLWSPDATSVAIMQPAIVTVANVSGKQNRWAAPPLERLLGWTRDAHDLLFWNAGSGHVTGRSASSGAVVFRKIGAYRAPPLPAPDGIAIALLAAGDLQAGSWHSGVHHVASTSPACRLKSWSGNGARLLLVCGAEVQEWTASGKQISAASLPANAFWVPGSATDLLFFRHGSLWRWSPPNSLRQIVAPARGVQPAVIVR